MTPDQLIRTYGIQHFFHFTDRRNVPSIRKHGLLSWRELQVRGVSGVIPGGNEWSHEADARTGMDGHVHLCLFDQHPMEYRAREEGRIVESVFLPVSARVLATPGALFTADVSNKSGEPTLTIDLAAEILDFEVVYTRTDWKDSRVQQRLQAAKKYELLLPNHVSEKLIHFPT